jgi:PleD family two-component response regulator
VSTEVGKLKLLTNAKPITLSIGITESAPNESLAQMLERADRALLLAREDGENCTRVLLAENADRTAPDSRASAVA